MNAKYCIIIYVSGYHAHLGRYWEESCFREKVESLNFPYVIWAKDTQTLKGRDNVVYETEGLLTYITEGDFDGIVYIEGTQLFFDIDLVKRATHKFSESFPDYYTQWEHSRIPIGTGVRVFSAERFRSSRPSSPGQYIDLVINNPRDFTVRYEDTKCAEYNVSLLDSRFSDTIKKYLDREKRNRAWNLNGFLGLSRKYDGRFPEYKPNISALGIDERKMPAAYGFESPQCADFPTYIMFDITNACNSRCVHCPHSITYSESGCPPVFIEMDIFKKVIDECVGRKLQLIRITADGEPLLHKGIVDMIDYATKKKVGPVSLTTNGSLMTPDLAERLMDSGLFMVDFSLDAARPQTYKKIRKGLPYDKVISNIESMLDIRNKKKSPLKIMVSFVEQDENRDERQEFLERWQKKVDKVLIRELLSNINLIDVKKDQVHTRRWPCPHVFRRIVVNYNGIIKACPIDWGNATLYKTVRETSVYDAWHSDFYWKTRLRHLNNEFIQGSACKDCRDWQGSRWNLGYEKVVNDLNYKEVSL